jgi:GPH family glycoside/pentoside/hexuronide:cation symporter
MLKGGKGIPIPYGSLMAIRTRSVEERSKMGLTRTIFGYIIGMIIAIALIPITNMLGGNQKAWIIVAVVSPIQNKYWVMLSAQPLIYMLYTLNGSTGIYYTKYILGNEDLIAQLVLDSGTG